ncbi:MAG: prepilin-type N-terminal cleavage/methylation domain-containing protein [Epulopiscium sp.]|nr:prepilin-type N-terminal cleavage/methylation domain-containing protein [Candidatus Epulonipiscium sp.]
MSKLKWILNNNRGFTLVEILIGMALFSILSLSVWSLMNHASNSSNRTYTKIEAVENARVALDFMIDEIRRAQKIQIENFDDANTILCLDMDGNNDISLGTGDVKFSFDDNTIHYNNVELVNNIQSISFDPPSLDKDGYGILDKEIDTNNDGIMDRVLDANEDGLLDENLKITIETISKGETYRITGEVSIRYKGIVKKYNE